ncbi:hypothetical protein [Terrimonas pollutisoli]|uniref:hypothetical protein n=1 Tax=Terrimonas pollutisoli TaxID=3034147 RepID=UPI0023EB3DCD|nr:hypothetical protein [Terrimonas sp. H1YJ31]
MKKLRIVQAALLVAAVALLASCSSGRRNSYGEPYPPRQANFSLIISSSPGMVIHRYHDGRYYYRNPYGYTYWRGYDNLYYLDRSYIRRVHYDRRQYDAWKHGSKRYYKRGHYRR